MSKVIFGNVLDENALIKEVVRPIIFLASSKDIGNIIGSLSGELEVLRDNDDLCLINTNIIHVNNDADVLVYGDLVRILECPI